ncbi:hypothetical protein CDD82_2609 [Ophiocordyceps australis]|uniref:Rab-GAP TBC domain-containing protein n=1 Tax=Ophiocordyceps australis TaxID=1399860 RepID=A0A2C5ZH89_9HYPO|nr:hypothetical protein CDD82_2609 [Ophiocordyceps australis]
MIHEHSLVPSALSSPGSPPGMTTSKSSKTSSFQSLNSDDESVLAHVGHFEEIGLDDDDDAGMAATPKLSPHIPVRPTLGHLPTSPVMPQVSSTGRMLAYAKSPQQPRRSSPNLQGNSIYASNPRSTSLTVLTDSKTLALPNRFARTPFAVLNRNRSHSPVLSPKSGPSPRHRRGSWQASRDRKSIQDLENECDEDDCDDIPDGIVLDNVPISPRPPHQRSPSRAPSISPSPNRGPKERVRSVGNGTPAVAQAQGSLRSPPWKSEPSSAKSPSSSFKRNTNSWHIALANLSAEAKALTEKLEEHADHVETHPSKRPSAPGRPNTWTSSQTCTEHVYVKKERVKSSTPELPPLRRPDIMVDPLPMSKEKEAVLSRTRPSWLPPKDPAEERRHLRQYQKLMAASAKAEARRAASRKTKAESRDMAAGGLSQVWESDVLPRWNEAVRERRTRDLWWQGVAPRSRGKVWTRAIGNDLGLSAASYHTALSRARHLEARVKMDRGDADDVNRVRNFECIRKDVAERTWKDLRIFTVGGPLHDSLVDVLSAYAMYRNDVGYVSGCNTIAALLLLNLPDAETAFIALANVLNRPLPLSFYTCDQGAQASAYNLVLQTLRQKSPPLYEHLAVSMGNIVPEMYMGDLFASIFTSNLTIDEAARLWDVYVFEGDVVLVRAAVAVLLSREMALLGTKTGDEVRAAIMSREPGRTASRAIGELGAEERFVQSVRAAGIA